MKSANNTIRLNILRSKVARRIFALFVLCALVPLTALALFSINHVTRQLKKQTDRRLHQASKTAAMTVFERLTFLDTDLGIVSASLGRGNTKSFTISGSELRDRVRSRFRNVVLLHDEGVVALLGGLPGMPRLSRQERQHLDSGKALVTTLPHTGGSASIFLWKPVDLPEVRNTLIVGEVSGDYLWGGEGFLSPTTELCALTEEHDLLFSSFGKSMPGLELQRTVRGGTLSGQFEWSAAGDAYLASYWTLFMRPSYFNSWILVHSEKKADVLEPLRSFNSTFLLVALLAFWVVLFLSLGQIRRSLVPIEQLRDATNRIKARDYGSRVRIASKDEFEELGSSFNDMAESLENHISVMNTMNRVGISLSAERDNARLLEVILQSAVSVINADAGALYLVSENRALSLCIAHIGSLDLWIDASLEPYHPLFETLNQLDAGPADAASRMIDRSVNLGDVYDAEGFDFSYLEDFDRCLGYRSQSLLSVPLKNHLNEIICLLQLINAKERSTGRIVPFSRESQRLAESLASQAAVALTKNRLVQDFKQLFEGLTELIGTAIDEKSPYTGSHCKRVPVLTMMLAEAANHTESGPLKDFRLSEDELYELKIAALLHDCGKVTTPVHIADKSTKLQTIFDRIHLIEARFEILRRDRRIELLQETVLEKSNGDSRERLLRIEAEMNRFERRLDQEMELLRKYNAGTSFMPESMREKAREIAFRYGYKTAQGRDEPVLSEDELYNLTIPAGTLNTQERGIINYHIVSTIKMLESLPYPNTLRNVPRHAGAHHERMDGKGYPLGLTKDQISIQGRMIAIADIFEALTARDRPYKKGNTLSEALEVLGAMKDQGHIDPDLYDLFVGEKLYLRYAEQFLASDQIDVREEALSAGGRRQ